MSNNLIIKEQSDDYANNLDDIFNLEDIYELEKNEINVKLDGEFELTTNNIKLSGSGTFKMLTRSSSNDKIKISSPIPIKRLLVPKQPIYGNSSEDELIFEGSYSEEQNIGTPIGVPIYIDSIIKSEEQKLEKFVEKIILALENSNITTVIFDFDCTISAKHTGGCAKIYKDGELNIGHCVNKYTENTLFFSKLIKGFIDHDIKPLIATRCCRDLANRKNFHRKTDEYVGGDKLLVPFLNYIVDCEYIINDDIQSNDLKTSEELIFKEDDMVCLNVSKNKNNHIIELQARHKFDFNEAILLDDTPCNVNRKTLSELGVRGILIEKPLTQLNNVQAADELYQKVCESLNM